MPGLWSDGCVLFREAYQPNDRLRHYSGGAAPTSTDLPLGGYPGVDLPEDFADSTSWQRAREEDTRVEPIDRAEWTIRVGGGDRHRVAFGTRSGTVVGECDCKGYTHHEWCVHLAAAFLAYVRDEIVDADLDEELAVLWRQYRRGGEA